MAAAAAAAGVMLGNGQRLNASLQTLRKKVCHSEPMSIEHPSVQSSSNLDGFQRRELDSKQNGLNINIATKLFS